MSEEHGFRDAVRQRLGDWPAAIVIVALGVLILAMLVVLVWVVITTVIALLQTIL